MPEIVLKAEIGRDVGTAPSKRLRTEGKIPGVVYGHGTDPVPVTVVGRDLRIALTGDAGMNALLSLEAGTASFLTVARALQRHPVKGTVTHVDFLIVRRDEVISADISITLIGEAIEVHHGDGLVDQQLFTLTVKAIPSNIPTGIELDISSLTIGGALRVADLVLPDGVTTEVDGEVPIAIGQPPRVQAVEAQEGEGEEPEEASAAPSGD
jgi:large subunit ribosomal protein L25